MTAELKSEPPSLARQARPGEMLIRGSLFICGALSVATTIGILYELGKESLLFFRDDRVSFAEFLSGTVWQPQVGSFGIWALILSTMLIALYSTSVT